jgi:hypothetical protein
VNPSDSFMPNANPTSRKPAEASIIHAIRSKPLS